MIYLFGAFLVVTGVRMATQTEHAIEPEANPVVRLVRRVMPGHPGVPRAALLRPPGPHARRRVRLVATPLFVVLVLVETTDLIFAVD